MSSQSSNGPTGLDEYRVIPAQPGWWAVAPDDSSRPIIGWAICTTSEQVAYGNALVCDDDGLVVDVSIDDRIVGPKMPD